MRPAFFALAALALTLAACRADEPAPPPASPSIPFRVDGDLEFVREGRVITRIAIEIADTDSARGRGLMQRTDFPDATGMLFLFPYAQTQSFYMANTPTSLDIMFFGPDSALINVAANTEPFNVNTVSSEAPSQFVVEMPAGFARRHGLVPGDRIRWTDRRGGDRLQAPLLLKN